MHSFFEVEKRMFSGYLTVFFDAYDEINKYKKLKGVYEYLYNKLFMLAIRALIYEMHLFKADGKLSGTDSEQRFLSFESITETAEFKEYFGNKYPVLVVRMTEVVSNTAAYVGEIFENFEKDKELIKKSIDEKISGIVDIVIGEGDTHNSGKSVVVIKTNVGKLVYKPHSLSSDYAFEKMIDWVNANSDNKLRHVKHVSGEHYGWQEHVVYDGDLSEQEAKTYYYRCGQFLALFHVLGTTDIHFENVIVNKDMPCFIDLETLICMPRYINYSNVLETDFIPGVHNNLVYDFDYSGLCGSGNISSKIKSISIVNPKTDEMRIDNVSSVILRKKNVVTVNGEEAKIEDYVEAVLAGFNEMWRLFAEHKEEAIQMIDKSFRSEKLHYRQVLRATQVYSKFLVASTHPDYLCEKGKQESLFGRLQNNVTDPKMLLRVKDEIRQLRKGDVPYFTVKYDSSDLYSDVDVVCKGYFENTVREGILRRVQRLNDSNKTVQSDIIRKSLFTAYNKQFVKSGASVKIEKEKYMEKIVKNICDKIVKDSTGTVMFINTLVDKRFYLSNINMDMYEGGGIIWLLACYGEKKKDPEILNLALGLFETAEKCFLNQVEAERGRLSAFSGVGSIIYLSYNLYLLTGKEVFLQKAEKYCDEIEKKYLDQGENAEEWTQYDYMCGVSGFLVVLCRIYQKCRKDKIKLIIEKLTDKFLHFLDKKSMQEIGIAHGISGIVYALITLYETFSEQKYKNCCITYLKQEFAAYLDKQQYSLEWCHGITGMLYVRGRAYMIWEEEVLKEQIVELLKIAAATKCATENNCLCHGVRGVKEGLLALEKITNIDVKKYFMFDELEEHDFYGINNHEIENFMMGTSGVAYSYLKEEYGMLPSIMALELYEA